MTKYTCKDLLDIEQLRKAMEFHHNLSGIAYGLFDTDENNLIAVGWRNICVRYHRLNALSCTHCLEIDAYIKTHLNNPQGDFLEYRCNHMVGIAVPITVEGEHMATLFAGQFFYDDDQPDKELYLTQVWALGFDHEGYLQALDDLPVFSREYVRDNVLFLRNMVNALTERGLNNLQPRLDGRERKRLEMSLGHREEEFRVLVENVPDPVVRYDRDARRIYVNPAFERVAGRPASQLLGKTSVETPVGKATVGALTHKAILRVLSEAAPMEVEVSWDDGCGTKCSYQICFVPELDRDGMVMSVLSIARDISLIRNYQQELQKLAFFDPLTELPNRALFNDRLHQAVDEAARHERQLGLMLLDLDRFKMVNDSLGHNAGDRLLCDVGQRIGNCVRGFDTVARLGGDKFAVILPELCRGESLGAIARKILDTFAEPFVIDGYELFITAGIGITFYPLDARNDGELIQCAELAMYHAKTMGRNIYQFYSANLCQDAA